MKIKIYFVLLLLTCCKNNLNNFEYDLNFKVIRELVKLKSINTTPSSYPYYGYGVKFYNNTNKQVTLDLKKLKAKVYHGINHLSLGYSDLSYIKNNMLYQNLYLKNEQIILCEKEYIILIFELGITNDEENYDELFTSKNVLIEIENFTVDNKIEKIKLKRDINKMNIIKIIDNLVVDENHIGS